MVMVREMVMMIISIIIIFSVIITICLIIIFSYIHFFLHTHDEAYRRNVCEETGLPGFRFCMPGERPALPAILDGVAGTPNGARMPTANAGPSGTPPDTDHQNGVLGTTGKHDGSIVAPPTQPPSTHGQHCSVGTTPAQPPQQSGEPTIGAASTHAATAQ
eukprot:9537681-Karenia_brevis.AAC.1